MPTPKKAGRAQLIKTLLKGGEVPEMYVDVYDKLEVRSVEGALREAEGLDEEARERIQAIFEGDKERELGRGEVNVLLALVGLAQEGEEVSLDGVDERRRSMFNTTYSHDIILMIDTQIFPFPILDY
jgi:sorting nexin-8